MKKNRIKKRNSIERVYKDGREAIVKNIKRKTAYKKLSNSNLSNDISKDKPEPLAIAPSIAAKELPCAIQEYKNVSKHIKVDEYELPSYNTITKITLITKDPFWLYAYWEISESSIEDVKKQLGGTLNGTKFIVRMYDVTYKNFNGFNANHWFDIEIGRYSNNWYINLWNDNASYCADLGILHNSGRFFPMARSNFVHTPRSDSSSRFEEIWMDLSEEFVGNGLPRTEVKPFPTNMSAESAVKYDTAGRFSRERLRPFPTRRKIFLNEADLRAYYNKLSGLLRDKMFSRISGKRIYKYLYSRMSESEWKNLFYFRRLAGAKFGRKIMIGASEFMHLGGSENILGGASEFAQQPEKKRKFFFEIGTELIVYGKTEHDAEVLLGDKKVSLRPDGTFSMRFALPDGKIPLPFTATSKDKIETKKISTTVERETE